jgi:hypothetical protein
MTSAGTDIVDFIVYYPRVRQLYVDDGKITLRMTTLEFTRCTKLPMHKLAKLCIDTSVCTISSLDSWRTRDIDRLIYADSHAQASRDVLSCG